MRNLCEAAIQKHRDHGADRLFGTTDAERPYGGAFLVPFKAGGSLRAAALLRVLASNGDGWDHVSVSLGTRCPTWEEMDYVKRLFFKPDETVMQLHVPAGDNVNNHPYCLHLWRPHKGEIPRPPAEFVGIPGVELTAADGLPGIRAPAP